MQAYIWCDTYGRNEIFLSQGVIDSVCHSGDNEPAVMGVMSTPEMQKELAKVNHDHLVQWLKELGAWEDNEFQDKQTNLMRLVWLAAWDCYESPDLYLQEMQ